MHLIGGDWLWRGPAASLDDGGPTRFVLVYSDRLLAVVFVVSFGDLVIRVAPQDEHMRKH